MERMEAIRILVDFLTEDVSVPFLVPAEAILLCGSNLSQIAIHAAALYHSRRALFIVVSGGRGQFTDIPEQWNSEAHFLKDIICKKTVSVNDVILETSATNTLENIQFGMKIVDRVASDQKNYYCRCTNITS
ncbi:MAG: YdcF family protein [Parcubacteria group bacterium]|nr:YdcF family protein [Parcubacteria group bacterium]